MRYFTVRMTFLSVTETTASEHWIKSCCCYVSAVTCVGDEGDAEQDHDERVDDRQSGN